MPKRKPRKAFTLSPRENDVLRGIRDGLSLPEIARKLKIGWETARTHLRSVRKKTGVVRRMALAMLPRSD